MIIFAQEHFHISLSLYCSPFASQAEEVKEEEEEREICTVKLTQ
jgi:hypothetical protein